MRTAKRIEAVVIHEWFHSGCWRRARASSCGLQNGPSNFRLPGHWRAPRQCPVLLIARGHPPLRFQAAAGTGRHQRLNDRLLGVDRCQMPIAQVRDPNATLALKQKLDHQGLSDDFKVGTGQSGF